MTTPCCDKLKVTATHETICSKCGSRLFPKKKPLKGIAKHKVTDDEVIKTAMLSAVPGVGDKRAGIIVKKYPTFEALRGVSIHTLSELMIKKIPLGLTIATFISKSIR